MDNFRSRFTTILATVLAAFVLGASFSAHAAGVVVPAYVDPDVSPKFWVAMNEAARNVKLTAIMNPNSGPGKRINLPYQKAINDLHAAGGLVIGYVSTSYGKRRLSEVAADINLYLAMYKVDGIFLDEMTADANSRHIQYYQSLYAYIKGLNPTLCVMGNPGTSTVEAYLQHPLADQLVTFEGSASVHALYVPQSWQARYPAERFVHIVYGAPAAVLTTIAARTSLAGAGNLYVTDARLPNPYDKLPTYWAKETAKETAAR